MRTILLLPALLASMLMASAVSAAPASGSLVKLACGAGDAPDHPCRAVYYYGGDGRRHAFPNERVYFSWYADFADVRVVTQTELAAIPLGKNVTYRPGSKLVKFTTDPKTYAVGLGGELRWVTSEHAAQSLYGPAWNASTDDISDVFWADYRFGTDIAQAADFSPSEEAAYARTIDDDLPSSRRSVTVTTPGGTFSADIITMRKDAYRMRTSVAEPIDCMDGCAAYPLAQHATHHGATIGIHGTYFCPPDYADCAFKRNTFLWPVFDSATRTMRNTSALAVHNGPMFSSATDGTYMLFHRTSTFGASVSGYESSTGKTLDAAIANYPSLVENGVRVVDTEPMLEDGMRTNKATRGGIGMNDRVITLVVARSATVPDLADIFLALGMTDAMNLDGGGSVALLYDNTYVLGPGRALPNAIVFTAR